MAVRPARLGLIAAFAAAAAACGGRGDPSAETVRGLVRAANRRDAAAIVAALAPDFRGTGGMSRGDLDAEIRRLFAAYASVDVVVNGLSIDRLPEFDVVRFRASFRGTVRRIGGLEAILPPTARYRFELRLVRGGDRRTIEQATWEEISP